MMGDSRTNPEVNVAELLRGLPAVDKLAAAVEERGGVGREWALSAARQVLDLRRSGLKNGSDMRGADGIVAAATQRALKLSRPSLGRVINATGVVLHTNLGRAPLSAEVAQQVAQIAVGYSTLEFDLETGGRGSRRDHVEGLICELTGAEAAFAVNNNAAAVTLALAATCSGREVVVSRGELVEIGGSFRVPDILRQSGATLIEVGTTNRTRINDYERAIGPNTGAVLRVHQSNFRTVGFTEAVSLDDLHRLAAERGVLLIEDLGSGAIEPIEDEPTIRESIRAGIDLVCASADKLLGGPQAGIIAGKRAAIEQCATHPLARAVRIDKLQLAALEATLRLYFTQGPYATPAAKMLHADDEELHDSAVKIAELIGPAASVSVGVSAAGGGTLPIAEFKGAICVVNSTPMSCDDLLMALRERDLPIIARISENRVVIDPRTLLPGESRMVGEAINDILARE